MSSRTITLTDSVHDYLLSISLREPAALRRLRQETMQLSAGGMHLSPEQGQLMQLLVKTLGARRALEVGVFTGCSATWVALGLPEDGQLIACDVSEEWTSIARRYWQEAGVAHKIKLHLAPAVQTLDRLLAEGQAGSFDFAFIDADKSNYDHYYERTLQLLRPGGLLGIDNVLWGGAVADPSDQSADTQAIRALNQKIYQDDRVDLSLIPIGDGFTLVRKK